MTTECLPVRAVYRCLTLGQAKRIPRDERCLVPVSPRRTCPNRRVLLVAFDTDPPNGTAYCEEHWAAAKVKGPCS